MSPTVEPLFVMITVARFELPTLHSPKSNSMLDADIEHPEQSIRVMVPSISVAWTSWPEAALKSALADHPDLLARLLS